MDGMGNISIVFSWNLWPVHITHHRSLAGSDGTASWFSWPVADPHKSLAVYLYLYIYMGNWGYNPYKSTKIWDDSAPSNSPPFKGEYVWFTFSKHRWQANPSQCMVYLLTFTMENQPIIYGKIYPSHWSVLIGNGLLPIGSMWVYLPTFAINLS